MIDASRTTVRELHSRVNDGIDVRLLWSSREDRLWVAVSDSKVGDEFVVEIRDRSDALDVFHHPFAYAACDGVVTGGPRAPAGSCWAVSG